MNCHSSADKDRLPEYNVAQINGWGHTLGANKGQLKIYLWARARDEFGGKKTKVSPPEKKCVFCWWKATFFTFNLPRQYDL